MNDLTVEAIRQAIQRMNDEAERPPEPWVCSAAEFERIKAEADAYAAEVKARGLWTPS